MKEFTPNQIDNFRQYEEVREEGIYNMFAPQALEMTGLTKQDYIFVMENYSELKAANES